MKILVIGSGGREHALVWKIKQSPMVKEIFCTPGNVGITQLASCVDIASDDIPALLKFAKDKKIDLTVVGPEVPLVLGIVDEFERKNLKIFGPSKGAAQLEGSKAYAKEFMKKYHIPTADFQVFTTMRKAGHFLKVLREADFPLVVKVDGLAAGKGVMICHTMEEARVTISQILEEKTFKEAGKKVVVEECLRGQELSVLAVCDGHDFVMMEASQDHKRIFDDDLGPNTGGMGAYCPVPWMTKDLYQTIGFHVIEPVLEGMGREGNPFQGILYAGLMLTDEGPKVLEFNVRFGDPETQAILPRLKTDLVEVMLASCEERLHQVKLEWDRRSCVCVVMSSGGYPGAYDSGKEIKGLDAIKDPATFVFHAGTKAENGKVVTAGGRVLGVTSLGNTLDEAIKRAYENVEKIKFEKRFFRRDIGVKALRKVAI